MTDQIRRKTSTRAAVKRLGSARSRAFVLRPRAEDLEVRRLLTVTINEFGGSATLANPSGIATGPDQNLWFTESNPSAGGIGRITPSGAIALYSNNLSPGAVPTGIAPGSDGALWFTEAGTDSIGRITTAGIITEFPIPTAGSFPDQITAGPDGALWFTEHDGNKIGRITMAGVVTEFPIPSSNSQPVGIATGPDGALWFAESNTDKIGRIDVSGKITEFATGITHNGAPTGIAAGPDGNLWFTELDGDRIGRITPSGVVTEYSTGISPAAGPAGITAGSDGRLWFAEQNDGKVGAITTSGVVTEYTSPSIGPTDGLAEIASGPDGNLWVTAFVGNDIDRVTTGGSIAQFPSTTNVITPGSNPTGIAAGPDDALWFTEPSGDKIGRIDTSGNISEFSQGISSGAQPDQITLGPVPTSGGSPGLWFTEPGTDSIGEITTDGVVTEFSSLSNLKNPSGITLGPDDNVWFAGHGLVEGNRGIGRITPAGVVTEFQNNLTVGARPNSIVTGPDDNLWFTATTSSGGEIGRITTAGVITEFPIPNGPVSGTSSDPMGITEGLNGDLWFTDPGNHAIGRITTSGVIQEYFAGLTVGDVPDQIATGPDGNYWFTDPSDTLDPVGRITPSGVITLYQPPTNPAGPLGIALGPDNNLWFTESFGNQIGQIVDTQSIINPTPTPANVTASVPASFTVATFVASAASNAANFSATIDYGDGTVLPGIILPLATPGQFEVVGSHTYATIGAFTATVTIGTGTGSLAPLSVPITSLTPLGLSGGDVSGIAGQRSNTDIATFSDRDTSAIASDFTATVTWSDNTTSKAILYPLPSDQFAVYAGHAFAFSGVFANSLTIVDNRNGFSTTASFSATISEAVSQTPFNEIGPDTLTPGSGPDGIALGPDGALWFTDLVSGDIGRVDTSGNVTEFSQGQNPDLGYASGPQPTSIVAIPGGALWFTDFQTDQIGRITTSGVVTLFSDGLSPGAGPDSIALGPDGNLWFTESAGNRIGRITPGGIITEFSSGLTPNLHPDSIATGPDGNLWFVGGGSNLIGRITPQGVIAEFPGATGVGLVAITKGPDGDLWFTEASGNLIGKIDPTTFHVTEYTSPSIPSPGQITAGPDGNLWFTDEASTQVGRITPVGIVTAFSIGLTPNSSPAGITPGPDGNLYFGEISGDRIGQVILPGTSVSAIVTAPPTATVGRPFATQIATFTDRSSLANLANFRAVIDWGDGTSTDGTVDLANGVFTVEASHAYASTGVFRGSVTILNAADGTAPISFAISVAGSLSATGLNVAAQAGQAFTTPVADFTDSAGPRSPGSYQLTIQWGDGTSSTGTLGTDANGLLDVIGTHSYSLSGSYTITTTVQVIDVPTDVASAASLATVSAANSFSTVVINTNDSGPGSLRQAILDADLVPFRAITFAIPGSGVATIVPLSPLPSITTPTVVDGVSQAIFESSSLRSPLVEVDGRGLGGASPGLIFDGNSGGSLLEGLSIFGFGGAQVELDSAGDFVRGDYLGLRADGTIPSAVSSGDGLLVLAPGAIIGGLGVGEGDVISGNSGRGIELSGTLATSARIFGDLIGLDPTGSESRGNAGSGVAVDQGAARETIGPGNVISGNGFDGIDLLGSGLDLVIGNAIGTDRGASRAIGNANAGVLVDQGSTGVTIGAAVDGAGNVISGNGSAGIIVRGGSTFTAIQGNRVGTDLFGENAVGNGVAGILISDSPDNVVGPGNLISGNGSVAQGSGIWIQGQASTANLVYGNAIGIDWAGGRSLGNSVIGVLIDDAPGNTIGGSFAGASNVISGNSLIGVMIAGTGASGNVVIGNLIGTDAGGSRPIANGNRSDGSGVYVDNAPGNVIVNNVISGNGFDGIQVFGPSSRGTLIQGNKIGTDGSGRKALGNGDDGVVVNGSPGTRIVSNLIASNANDGITISGPGASGTQIRANLIGQGANRKKLGNQAFGILVVNGAPMPVAVGNTNQNNTLGPIRDTKVAPASPSKVHQPTKATVSKLSRVAVPKAKIQPKASSFRSRPMPKLQHPVKATRKAR